MNKSTIIIDMLTACTALTAVIISLLSYLNSKRKTTAEIITINRMEWIKTVRQYCTEFLIELKKEKPSSEFLEELYVKIQLYGFGTTYDELFNSLEMCIAYAKEQSENCDLIHKYDLIKKVLKDSQKILNGVWWRMKREAGISSIKDKRIARKYRKIYK